MRNQKTIPCSSVCIRGPFTVAAETRVGRFCAGQLPPRTTEKHGNNDRGITRINTDEKSENNSVFVRVHPRSFYRRRGNARWTFLRRTTTATDPGKTRNQRPRNNTDQHGGKIKKQSVFVRVHPWSFYRRRGTR